MHSFLPRQSSAGTVAPSDHGILAWLKEEEEKHAGTAGAWRNGLDRNFTAVGWQSHHFLFSFFSLNFNLHVYNVILSAPTTTPFMPFPETFVATMGLFENAATRKQFVLLSPWARAWFLGDRYQKGGQRLSYLSWKLGMSAFRKCMITIGTRELLEVTAF